MKKSFVMKLAIAMMLALGTFTTAQEDTAIPAVDAAVTPVPEAVAAGTEDNQASVSDNVVVEGEVSAVDSVAPVAPVEENVVYDSSVVTGGDCVGCGQAAVPMMSTVGGQVIMNANVGCQSCGGCQTGCATACNTGCNTGCGTVSYMQPATYVQTATYAQPSTYVQTPTYIQPATYVDSGCACNNGVAQVSYDQPVYQPTVAQPVATNVVSGVSTAIVNPAPAPVVYAQPAVNYAQPVVNTGCSSCGSGVTTNYAPMTTTPAVVTGTNSYVPTSYVPAVTTGCNDCAQQRGGRLRGRIFRGR